MTKIKNIFSPAFFIILKEPKVVQKQTIHQQKAHDRGYLEPEEGRSTIRKVPRPLAVKAYFNANEAENMRSFAEQFSPLVFFPLCICKLLKVKRTFS